MNYSRRLDRVLSLLLFVSAATAFGQVNITSVMVDGALIGPTSLFSATVQNSGGEVDMALDGDLKDRAGETVLTFKAEPLRIQPGIKSLTSADLRMRSFIYSTTDAGRSAQLFHRLPGGRYTFCLRVNAGVEGTDEYCDDVLVDEFITLDLLQPWNKDTIDEVRPTLTWSMSGAGPGTLSADVRLVLSPMPTGLNPAQALSRERPLFMIPHVTDRSVPYPVGASDLVRGQCYAWQVERIIDGRVHDRSEPWGFCVRQALQPVANKYVLLDDIQPGSQYNVTDQRIYFRYDEAYTSEQLQCSVYARGTQLENVSPSSDQRTASPLGGSSSPKSIGVNLYEFDITEHGLKAGYYTLVVRNEKGRTFNLPFRIER